jgi:hypothetical protein
MKRFNEFDVLQFLWVGGLFIGQRFLENKSLLPMPHLLRPLLVLSAIAFLFWRWISITSGADPITQTGCSINGISDCYALSTSL